MIPRIVGHIAAKDMEEFHHAPDVDLGVAHGRAALEPIDLDEKEMAGAPDLELPQARLRPGAGPEDVALNAELTHDIAGLIEILDGVRPRCRNRAFIARLLAVLSVFMKRPGRMIEKQAAKGEEPEEEDQEQASIEMQLAIPAFEARPWTRGGFGSGQEFSG